MKQGVKSDSILAYVGAAAFETDDRASFLLPSTALAELFLGPGAKAEDLNGRYATEFYVLSELRPPFFAAVRAAQGRPVTDYVLLNLPGGQAWCRLRAVMRQTKEGERFSGLVVRLDPDENWMPGELLARIGWAYLRVDRHGTIRYASRYASKQMGIQDPQALLHRQWSTTHWARAEDCTQFIQEAWQRTESSAIVEFARSGQTFRVELHAKVRRADLPDATDLEVFWREEPDAVVEQDARSAALSLREQVARLDTFENAIIDAVAAKCMLRSAALYRYHAPARRYILRAERGIPAGCVIPRELAIDLEPDVPARPPAPFIVADQWKSKDEAVVETLIPIHSASRERIGFLWLPSIPTSDRTAETWARFFARYLGIVVQGAEIEAAKRAASFALRNAVELLLSGDPSLFYKSFLELLLKETSAAAGSIFAFQKRDGDRRLCLVATTGIKDVEGPNVDRVTYRFNEGLTGTMASRKDPVSLLDIDDERAQLKLGPARYTERLNTLPVTWLGCPVFDEGKKLTAYIRLVNRRVGDTPGPPAGFSEGDLMLVQELARVGGQFHDLKAILREHQEVIARSFHELNAPLVAIRAHAAYLSKHLDYPTAPTKCANIQADAESLLQILSTIEVAGRERQPQLEQTWLLARVIIPLRFGLSELARRRGYTQLDVAAEDLRSLPKVWIDPAMMRQVFYNLLVNAIKYGPDDGGVLRVQITWTADKGNYRIVVRDSGIGIAPGHETKVFVQYHRIEDAVARDPTGSGIGLFVVKRIIEQHGGHIAVTNHRNPTEFTITLPKEPKK